MSINEIDINECYFHSIIHGAKESFVILDSIISNKAILSPRILHKKVNRGCHKDNEICLSHITDKPSNIEDYLSCFDIYVSRLMSFIIDKEIARKNNLYKPELLSTSDIFDCSINNSSYTNLYDEYRAIGRIPFKYIKGICIPYNQIINDPYIYLTFLNEEEQIKYYNGYVYLEDIDKYKLNNNKISDKNKRIQFMDKYIDSVEKLIKFYNIKLPIYLYDDKKLVLK